MMYNELTNLTNKVKETKTKNLPCWQELSTRKKHLLVHFENLGSPYTVNVIDGEPVIYRREKRFDVEISQSKQSPFHVYIWSLGESGLPQEIVRCYEVQSHDTLAAADEIDNFVEDYMSEVADGV